jgi:hypothetical protein
MIKELIEMLEKYNDGTLKESEIYSLQRLLAQVSDDLNEYYTND